MNRSSVLIHHNNEITGFCIVDQQRRFTPSSAHKTFLH